jgi:hypothetical protein
LLSSNKRQQRAALKKGKQNINSEDKNGMKDQWRQTFYNFKISETFSYCKNDKFWVRFNDYSKTLAG